jgi:uncharacterized damage-inducible protein DinB
MLRLFTLLFTCLLLTSGSPCALAQQDPFLKDYLERWETSRQYMLAVAEAMPEKEYGFKPTPEEMTFADQLMHIAAVIDWHGFSKADGQEYPPRWKEFRAEGRTKKEMIQMIDREFRRTAQLVVTFDPSRLDETGSYAQFTRTRRQFLLLMADHVTHHRAQMVVYLRLKGIVPPNYIGFQ